MRWLALLLLFVPALARAAGPCDPCALPNGSYRAIAPAGWNGTDKLRLLLFIHGWRNTGSDIATSPVIAGPASRNNYLLIAPDGVNGGWNYVGSPHHDRDDRAFLLSVVADAEARWPIDRRTVVAGGFSIGGSMTWDLACYAAPQFTAFIAYAGGFWNPLPDACTSGPVSLRHTHGTRDTMVPMQGRAILDGKFRQGDILQGFERWKAEDQCPAQPNRTEREGTLTCSTWAQCGSGHGLQMCLHDGDHIMEEAWLDESLRWAAAQ